MDLKEDLGYTGNMNLPTLIDVSTSISDGCGSVDQNCGIYLKITDPNGNVILDKSTPETGIAKRPMFSDSLLVIGQYTVWLKLSDPKKTLYAITVRIDGAAKQ